MNELRQLINKNIKKEKNTKEKNMLTNYQKYQLQWMIEHEHSLDDLISALENHQKETSGLTVSELFEEWENDIGFTGSEIWACEDEWKDNEEQEFGVYSVQFVHTDTHMPDEMEFDILAHQSEAATMKEIVDLFSDFCKENNYTAAITGIERVN